MSLMHRQRWFKSVGIVIFLTAFGSACSKDMQEQPSFAPREPLGNIPPPEVCLARAGRLNCLN